MTGETGLEHLTLLGVSPPDLVSTAAQAGFSAVGLRISPATDGERPWPVSPGSPMLAETVRRYDDPQIRRLTIKASGCPNSCGHHWIADFGFYGNARKIDGRELPYYQMLLGGGYDEEGIMRFGLAVQSIPARLAPEAVERVLGHYLHHRQPGETFRNYVLRHKVETFRTLTADLAKPAEMFPEIYQDWGDDEAFSLQLGRGECAA